METDARITSQDIKCSGVAINKSQEHLKRIKLRLKASCDPRERIALREERLELRVAIRQQLRHHKLMVDAVKRPINQRYLAKAPPLVFAAPSFE